MIDFDNINYQVNWYPKDKNTFRYTVIDNIFKESFRMDMLDYFNVNCRNKMKKFDHYDCQFFHIKPSTAGVFSFLYSTEWKKFISNIFPDIPLTNNTIAEIQHHNISSPSGWVHNDYDASQFINEPLENGINVWDENCPYRASEPSDDFITDVRSIAMIYHLNDKENWVEGDGGETAFYDDAYDDKNDHVIKVNPVPNRLLVYEINPFSFHNFKSNLRHERTTFTQWYHTSMKNSEIRYNHKQTDVYKPDPPKEVTENYGLQK